tara:strand:- start:374 stop:577 length:204 start_codon:yes stop_codon:yes gene_type:complete
MQGFYNLSDKIRETLQLDQYVNTVTYGDIFDVDLNKQTIFPLSISWLLMQYYKKAFGTLVYLYYAWI